MKDRITAFLSTENKTSLQFAEEIGVQQSSKSHIISGRNNPSLEYILKMLNTYDFISTEWLLFGKGKMYKNEMEPTLFDINNTKDQKDNDSKENTQHHDGLNDKDISKMEYVFNEKKSLDNISAYTENAGDIPYVEKIVWFYREMNGNKVLPL